MPELKRNYVREFQSIVKEKQDSWELQITSIVENILTSSFTFRV